MMLTLKSVRIVTAMRKSAVMRSSTVRTQVGGDGIACGVEDVELLSLVTLVELDVLGSAKAGGDRDTSSGLGRCARGRIVARTRRRGTGTQYVMVPCFVSVALDWSMDVESAMVASKATSSLILGGSGGVSGRG